MKWEDIPELEYDTKPISYLPTWIRNLCPAIYFSNKFLVLDFETTTIDKGNPHLPENQIVLAGWWYKGEYYEQYGNEYELDLLLSHIELCDFVVCHNAKFELGWLKRAGVDVSRLPVWDTQVGEYVLRGNREHRKVGLEATAKRRGLPYNKIKVIEKLWALGIETYDIPKTLLSPYCQRDVFLALAIFLEQRKDIIQSGLLAVHYARCWLPVVLMDIESRGLALDKERVDKVYTKVQNEFNQLYAEVVKFTGGVDIDSPVQLRTYLYNTLRFNPPTRYGRPWLTDKAQEKNEVPSPENYSTNAEALKTLKSRTKKQKEFLKLLFDYKTHFSQLTKYLGKFVDCCKEAGGILTANLNQTVTKTHRLSSNGRNYPCQFQNFDRRFKPLFTSHKQSYAITERDQSTLEFRVAIELGQDVVGYRALADGVDFHAETATKLDRNFLSLEGDARAAARTDAKSRTFKPLYGGTSGTKNEQRYYDYFKRQYRGITDTQDGWIKSAISDKRIRNPLNGLIFYFPYAKITRSGYITDNEKIRNINIQSVASADIVLVGVSLLWHLINHYKCSSI